MRRLRFRFHLLAATVLLLAWPATHLLADETKSDGDKEAEERQKAAASNPWQVNPFQKNKYIQAYPPDKFGYSIQGGKLVFRGTYDYETSLNGKLQSKQAGEDLFINFLFRNSRRIPQPTGNKHGIGTIRDQLAILGKDATKNREEIARLKGVLKILEKDQSTVNVFDGFRYHLRRPTRYYDLRDPQGTNLAPRLDQTALLGYAHAMQEFQIDESGLLTEEGARLIARDDKEDMAKDAGGIFLWWDRAFNHWADFPEFPMLPPDIDYIRARQLFVVQNIMADWDVSYKEAQRQKSIKLIDAFCRRWFGKPVQEVFNGLNDYSWRNIKPIAKMMGKNIQKEDNRYRDWLRGEYKNTFLAEQDLYAMKPGARHKEAEVIAMVSPGVFSFQNNECEFVGRESVEIVGLDGKTVKYDCLHFRREVGIENLKLEFLDMTMDKWRDDIWFEPRLRLTVKREFDLSFSANFIQQVKDPKNPQAPPVTKTEACVLRYRTNLELVQRTPAQKETKVGELKGLKTIVNAFNTAVGADYKSVQDKLATFRADYMAGPKESDFAKPVEILEKQCGNMVAIFTPERGYRRHAEIYPDEFFCSYVPEDFNPADRYGLIVFLADEGDDTEARIKEWGTMMLGKKLIVIGYRPQGGKYNHAFGQSADRLYAIIRSLGNTYNIDPARRFMVGAGKGAQMVLTMAAYSLSDFDRFSLYMPITDGYLPFNEDCRTMLNSPQGQACQQAIVSTSYLFIYPGQPKMQPTAPAPDAYAALATVFANIHGQSPKFENYIARLQCPEESGYSLALAKFILNKAITGYEADKKGFFTSLGTVTTPPPAPAQ
jgi:hypothetical protein